MGFYFRKSIGKGPFRINFSKSGISYSLGVKGARVNVSNRGTYVNFGSNGLYYRKKISDFGKTKNEEKYEQKEKITSPIIHEQQTITSGNLEKITDIDSQDFINELSEKSNKISYFNWFGIPSLILALIIFTLVFFIPDNNIIIKVTETTIFIKKALTTNINVRENHSSTSKILGIIDSEKKFELRDEMDNDWYRIEFKGHEGYVAKKITEKVFETKEIEKSVPPEKVNLYEKKTTLFWLWLIVLFTFFGTLLYYLKQLDNKRFLIEIYYNLDEGIKDVYKKFVFHFSELLNCSKVWQYLHKVNTYDYKYSSGASQTITRKPLINFSTNKTPSRIFKTNIEIPYLGLINTELYFFPERLIVKRENQFAAIMYKNIECYSQIISFIEPEGVPSDSNVLDYTWRYLNKDGSPDRRFNNNYQIPICEYSQYSFNSVSGLNEQIATSKVGGFDNFLIYIRAIGQLQKRIPSNTNSENIKSIKR